MGAKGNWSCAAYQFFFISAFVNQLPDDVTVSVVACYMKGCLTTCHCVNLSQHRLKQVLRNCALIMKKITTISIGTTKAAATAATTTIATYNNNNNNNNNTFLCSCKGVKNVLSIL